MKGSGFVFPFSNTKQHILWRDVNSDDDIDVTASMKKCRWIKIAFVKRLNHVMLYVFSIYYISVAAAANVGVDNINIDTMTSLSTKFSCKAKKYSIVLHNMLINVLNTYSCTIILNA